MARVNSKKINNHPKCHAEWLIERQKGIGGSDASCIVNANKYKSRQQLLDEKSGKVEAEDISNKECVKYGKDAERHIREIFALDFADKYQVEYDEFGIVNNDKECQFSFATLDGKLIEGLDDGTLRYGILEIKTTTIYRHTQWEQWDDQVPQHYYIQILHQLMATQYDFAILRVDIRHYVDKELRHLTKDYYFDASDEQIKTDIEFLKQEEIKFWKEVEKEKTNGKSK